MDQNSVALKCMYIKLSATITANVKYQGTLTFDLFGIDPSSVLDCFINPHNSLPNNVFMSIQGDQHFVWSNTYSGKVFYGLLILYK